MPATPASRLGARSAPARDLPSVNPLVLVIVRQAYEAWNRGDLEWLLDHSTADSEFHVGQLFPDAEPVYRGREGLKRLWTKFRGPWKTLLIGAERIEAIGGDRVLVSASVSPHGRGRDGFEVSREYAHLLTIEGGNVSRLVGFADRAQALEAAGLSEQAMSEENVETVKVAYEAFAHGRLDRFMEHFTDDVDYRAAENAPDDIGPIHGKDALRAWLQDWMDTFDGFWMELVELIDAGGVTVVAAERFGGRARLSGVETHQIIGGVFTIRDGKIARGREYISREQALEAAGLSE